MERQIALDATPEALQGKDEWAAGLSDRGAGDEDGFTSSSSDDVDDDSGRGGGGGGLISGRKPNKLAALLRKGVKISSRVAAPAASAPHDTSTGGAVVPSGMLKISAPPPQGLPAPTGFQSSARPGLDKSTIAAGPSHIQTNTSKPLQAGGRQGIEDTNPLNPFQAPAVVESIFQTPASWPPPPHFEPSSFSAAAFTSVPALAPKDENVSAVQLAEAKNDVPGEFQRENFIGKQGAHSTTKSTDASRDGANASVPTLVKMHERIVRETSGVNPRDEAALPPDEV